MTAPVALVPRQLLGLRLEVTVEPGPTVDPDHIDALLAELPAAVAPGPVASLCVAAGSELPRAGALLQRLDELAIEQVRRSHAVVHAAGVQRGPVTLVVPGASGSGKSTLAAALVMAGWQLLSDEIVPLALGSGEATPCPLGVRLRSPSWRLLGLAGPDGATMRRPFPVAELAGATAGGARPAVPSAVVVLDRGDGRPRASAPAAPVRATGRALGLERLARATANLAEGGAPVWATLRSLAERSATLHVTAGHPHQAAEALTRWADGQVDTP